ncbi:sigma-70 family RNA polymerase sigma factor [Solirubrobacter taibaiensis]|nr:sigma-70 family RNA polymerase sigma factor [Solirubrobacter taibaiensis]
MIKLNVSALVHAARTGDERAWTHLVEQVTPVLRRAAAGFRLRPEDLDDVVQQTWLQACTQLHALRDPDAVVGWLVVTVRREALRSLQRGVDEVLTDEPPEPRNRVAMSVEDTVLDKERLMLLQAAVTRLPDRQRVLLEQMISSPGIRYGELAITLDMPIGSIGPTRERALARLRDEPLLAEMVA